MDYINDYSITDWDVVLLNQINDLKSKLPSYGLLDLGVNSSNWIVEIV